MGVGASFFGNSIGQPAIDPYGDELDGLDTEKWHKALGTDTLFIIDLCGGGNKFDVIQKLRKIGLNYDDYEEDDDPSFKDTVQCLGTSVRMQFNTAIFGLKRNLNWWCNEVSKELLRYVKEAREARQNGTDPLRPLRN